MVAILDQGINQSFRGLSAVQMTVQLQCFRFPYSEKPDLSAVLLMVVIRPQGASGSSWPSMGYLGR
jgi:hypothetical protein